MDSDDRSDDVLILSPEDRQRLVNEFRQLPDEQIVEIAQAAARSESERLTFLIPLGNPRIIHCRLPNNNHTVTASRGYVCGSDPTHEFCRSHTLTLCPLDGAGFSVR